MRKVYVLTACMLFFNLAFSQRGNPPKAKTKTTLVTKYAQHLDFLPEMVKLLKVPPGWEVSIAASGLGKPRMLY
ncbi:MAG: glucose dehydrogenase, partial [Chitinophagaceae bacterium]